VADGESSGGNFFGGVRPRQQWLRKTGSISNPEPEPERWSLELLQAKKWSPSHHPFHSRRVEELGSFSLPPQLKHSSQHN
jgi:hypothetical protein